MDIKTLQKKYIKFRDKRDWRQFHNPKDLAISLALEAAEVLEHFQWKNDSEVEEYIKSEKIEHLKDEVADVAIYLFLLAHELGIDLEKAYLDKMRKNDKKYPVEKAKGSRKKYTEYE